MKLKIFSLLIAVLMSTAVLTSCSKAPAGAESSGGSGENLSTAQSGEPSTSKNSSAEKENTEQIGLAAMEKWKNICAALFEDVNTLTKSRLASIYTTYYIQTVGKLDDYHRQFPKADVANFAADYFGIDIYSTETAAALGIGSEDEFAADAHADAILYGDYTLLGCAKNPDGTYTMSVKTVIDLEGLFPPEEDHPERISTVKFSYGDENIRFISAEYTQDGEKIP